MKIVLDTNVLVSGIFFSGPPNRVLERWLDEQFQLYVSAAIPREYERILKKMALKFPGIEFEEILALIRSRAITVRDTALPEQVCSDPDDDKFLACALESSAMLVVSGDVALLETNGHKGIQVLNPASFLLLLGKSAS